MKPRTKPAAPLPLPAVERTMSLALSLAQAENEILDFTAGQIDAIVDPDGRTYLLRPAQEHLRQNESWLQAIIDGSADVITVLGRGGIILSQNKAVRRMLGYEPEELIGKNFFEIIYEEDVDRLYSAFFTVIEGFHDCATAQFHHPIRKGSYRLLEATVGRLGDGPVANVVLTMRPVTSGRLKSPKPPGEVIHVARAKDHFLAMLSHELRTPLMPVVLGVEELRRDERFVEARDTLGMIRRNVDLQLRLLEELSDFTMVGEHKVRLRLETIDLHETIRFVLETCRGEISAAEIEVIVDTGDSAGQVVADSVRLQQVMWNLVRNSLKFSPPGSRLTITIASGPADQLTVNFCDQGIGIEAALLPLVFDAFRQGSAAEQQARGGLGLGLFIAKGLTEAQGGTLSAHSEGRSKGATFRLTLPKAPLDRVVPPTETDTRIFHPASHSLPA